MCVPAHGYSACRSHKGIVDPLDLDLQAIFSFSMWVLGMDPGSSARVASALSC